MDYDIERLVGEMNFHDSAFQKVGKNLMLTNHEIEVLDRFKIEYQKCSNLKDILFEIEEIIRDMDVVDEELDLVSQSISERDYYQNTNK